MTRTPKKRPVSPKPAQQKTPAPQAPEPPDTAPVSQTPTPGPVAMIFAAAFVIAMFYNLYIDTNSVDYEGGKITMFLGLAALVVLGVDVGRLIGRR